MPAPVQKRLLRFMETRRVRRLGSTRERQVDARVLAATHRDLSEEVAAGRFREDLFYRLVVFRLRIPPLRERPEDILPLAQHFLTRLAARDGPGLPLADSARQALLEHGWPGNVRELAHTMERASLGARFAGADAIESEHLCLPGPPVEQSDLVTLQEMERRHIRSVLARVGGRRQQAAEILGLSERQLYRRLKAGRPAAARD